MIKILKNKFLICMFVLVVSVFITSTCYADITTDNITSFDSLNLGITMDDVFAYLDTVDLSNTYNLDKYYALYRSSTGAVSFYFYDYEDFSYLYTLTETYPYGSEYRGWAYNSDGVRYTTYSQLRVDYVSSTFSHQSSASSGAPILVAGVSYFDDNVLSFIDISTVDICYTTSDNIVHVGGSYVPTIDTSFNYSFQGVKRGQTKLSVTDLDSSLRMYGYVGLENTFNVGDTLDTSSTSSYLRLLAMYTDNSDLDCYLYDGEELLYYIVDENNVILDIGYISEMAKGNFLYGFNVYNGVDFVFLRDGQVYWDNYLTFKYSIHDVEVQNNNIVSMGESSYIVTDKTVASNIYKGYVYDSNGSLISQASATSSNDLSSISISVDTNYFEQKVGLNKSCYWLMSFDLNGTNFNGSSIDFSNYYVRWSIPTWIVLDSLDVYGSSYSKRNGIFNGISSSGYSGMVDLKIFELIKDHKAAFDITLQVYDSDDNLVLTHIINSDDIVKNQVSKEENNVDKGDYDILDNPNYTGGSSSSPNIDNIQDWTADDYLNLMSTDNFVWEFFKAILGNLPWWITVPLTILIFGVVIITLIRFARGA